MKKIQILLVTLFFYTISFGIDFSGQEPQETVLEIQIENELSDRIREYLDPLIGRTLVFVDLELEYPQSNEEFYGTEMDLNQSLPGLPVAKSTSSTDNFGLENKKDMTRIVSKNINVIISDKIKEKKKTEIEELLNDWLRINSTKDILLIQQRELIKEAINTDYTILFVVFLISVFFATIMIRSGFRFLALGLKKIKIAEFGNVLRIKGDVSSTDASSNVQSSSGFHFNQKEPIPIAITDTSSENEYDFLDYSFIENLPTESVVELIKRESSDDIAFILSKLDTTFSSKVMLAMGEDSAAIIEALTSDNPRSQQELKKLKTRVSENYSEFEQEGILNVDGSKTLISLINNMPAKESTELFEAIKAENNQMAVQIRKQVFLFNDILELSDNAVKAFMKTLHHDLIIKFFACHEGDYRDKFFKNMTQRSISIILEDVELQSNYSEEEKIQSSNEVLMVIRKMLNYL